MLSMATARAPLMVVVPRDNVMDVLSFYLGLSSRDESAQWPCRVFKCARSNTQSFLWVACVEYEAQSQMRLLVNIAEQRGFNLHIYNGQYCAQWNAHVSFAPGATWTLQTWLGSQGVRQLGQEVLFGVAQVLRGSAPPSPPSPVSFASGGSSVEDDTELQQALTQSLDAYAQEQRQPSPAPHAWMENLRRHSSEPSRVGAPECVLCLDKYASVVLVNCGHQVMCDGCALDLCERSGRHLVCPTCRTHVDQPPVHSFPSRIREH